MSKTFTVEEARTLLPVLSALLERARSAALRAGELENEMQELSQRIFLSGGLHVDVPAAAKRRAEREKAMGEARSTLEEITAIGVEVSESADGELEFPSSLEGRAIRLCWTLGDEEITHWREESDEADIRRLMDGRFAARRERERPN